MNTITAPSTYRSLGDHLAIMSKSSLLASRYDNSFDLPRLFMPDSIEALLEVRFPGVSFDVESLIEELEALSVDPVLERDLFSIICVEHRVR